MSDIVKFEFNGTAIRSEGDGLGGNNEMVNLTDMWKACGSDPNKRPVDWIRREGAPFIEFIEENLKVAVGHFEIVRTIRGGTSPATWAHWQLGMAYAKYLSHELHAGYNAVVRAHIEGKNLAQGALQDQIVRNIEAKFGAILTEKLEQVTEQLTVYRADAKNSETNLAMRLDHIERHKHGLMGEEDARELRRQMTEVAHQRIALGEAGKFLSIYRSVDDAIRREVGYPNEKGAKWELCDVERGTRAFSRIGMMSHSVSTALNKKRAAEKKAAAEKQIEMFCKAVQEA